VSPKQLLGATELQQHVCDPVKDSWEQTGDTGQPQNTRSPHDNSKTMEHLIDSRGHSSNPSTTDSQHSRHQIPGKLMKTGLQYSHSIVGRPSNDKKNQVGVTEHPQPRYHQYRHWQSERQRIHDHGQQMTRGSIHGQLFYDTVSFVFSR